MSAILLLLWSFQGEVQTGLHVTDYEPPGPRLLRFTVLPRRPPAHDVPRATQPGDALGQEQHLRHRLRGSPARGPEANADLSAEHAELIAARDRVPAILWDDDQVSRAHRFGGRLTALAGRCRRARLDDTKPLREFVRRVEAFFKEMETELAATRDDIAARLTEAARRSRQTRSSRAAIHVATSGEVIAEVRALPAPAAADLPLIWDIETLDRATLGLEALRPHLTDAALLTAARAHLEASGPHRLSGASYEEKVVLG